MMEWQECAQSKWHASTKRLRILRVYEISIKRVHRISVVAMQ